MTYSEACSYIEGIPKFTKKNRPDHTRDLLDRLGHPEEGFRIIHVAGTNGKGSVCAMLESILREQGYRTGLFSSPHLVSIRERFQISGSLVSEDLFAEAFRRVVACVRGMEADGYPHPAYFEFLFAMGLLIFQREQIDVLVMETGLGGRLDATNAVRRPDLTVLTSISLDHMAYLGDTVEAIAGEKAGIIKPGVPVVADGFSRADLDLTPAWETIRRRAEEVGSPLTLVREDRLEGGLSYLEDGISFMVRPVRAGESLTRVRIPFLADYQVENALVAMEAARQFGEACGTYSAEAVRKGLERTRWPGRMELVAPGILLDGAHNADGIDQFLKTARRIRKQRPLTLLFTAVSDKDYQTMIAKLCARDLFRSVLTTQVGGERAVPADLLADLFRDRGMRDVTAVSSPQKAFRLAVSRRGDSLLFCVGSLYLAGVIKADLAGREGEPI